MLTVKPGEQITKTMTLPSVLCKIEKNPVGTFVKVCF